MNPPSTTPAKRTLVAGSVILALAAAGILAWWHFRAPVRAEEVAGFLNKAVGAGKVGFSDVRIGITRQGDSELQLTVAATARTLFPLYAKVETADYLHTTYSLDSDLTEEARLLISGNETSHAPEYARLRPFPPDPFRAVILRATAKAGASFSYQAVIAARRQGDAWGFTLVSGAYEGASPAGEARSGFGDSTFVAGDAGDDERLRELAAGLQAFAGRVDETRRNIELAHAVAVNVRRVAYLSHLAPGCIFRGVATRTGEQQGTALYLEITGNSPGGGVTALLRNAGGWHYARAFQGSWSADEEFQNPALSLSSTPDQAIRGAGPFLENAQTWTFSLHMDPRGTLSEADRSYQYRFEFVDSGQSPALKAGLDAEFARAQAATAPGSLYRGTAVSKATGASEQVLLRFNGRSEDGESLQAAIESTSRLWKRPLGGAVMGNSRRSGGVPVRLRTGAKDAVEEAQAESVLGDPDDLELRLAIEDGSLVGGDERFAYRFAPVGAGDLDSLDAARRARAERFGAILRDGIAYDGTIRDEQGSVTEARLEIAHIDRKRRTVAASIHSLVQLGVYQDFTGTWSPSDASLTLDATGRGEFDSSDDLAVPFLVAPVAHTLELALVGNAIAGAMRDDTHWTMEFPVGSFLLAQTEGAEPDSPGAGASVFPPFPTGAGAYLLAGGGWKRLPRDNGHVVVETVHPMTDEELTSGPLGLVSQGVRRLAQKGEKLTFLDFDGKDPRPESGGASVVLLYVGPEPAGSPPVELASVVTMKDGRRRIQVLGGTHGAVRFGEQRSAAYVRKAGPGAILLTTTAKLAPGPYALYADAGYELEVR